jgi:hypothetical protein
VRDVQIGRPSVRPYADRRDQVQPQQRQVDEIVARQRLVPQVRVDQPQAAEPTAPGADATDLGQVDARGIADEDVLDLAAPADQDPDLPLDLARDAAQVRGELCRRDFSGTEPPPVNAFERVFLAGLEPRDIAADDVQGGEVSTAGGGLPNVRDIVTGSPLADGSYVDFGGRRSSAGGGFGRGRGARSGRSSWRLASVSRAAARRWIRRKGQRRTPRPEGRPRPTAPAPRMRPPPRAGSAPSMCSSSR